MKLSLKWLNSSLIIPIYIYLSKGPSGKRTQELFQHIRNWLRIITVSLDMIHLQYSWSRLVRMWGFGKRYWDVLTSLQQFHKYWYGQPFFLRIYHASLRLCSEVKNTNRQIMRSLQLQDYGFTIEHRGDKSQGNDDSLIVNKLK